MLLADNREPGFMDLVNKHICSVVFCKPWRGERDKESKRQTKYVGSKAIKGTF